MKRILSIIVLIILLTSAICSCRTSKKSSIEYSDSTSVSLYGSASTLSKDEILSLISASRELDVSGIKVEFFPPDSAHPNSRAAPKSLTIENVMAKESTEETTQSTSAVDEQKTVNLSAQSSSDMKQDSKSEKDMPSASWSSVCLLITCLLILLLLIYLLKK